MTAKTGDTAAAVVGSIFVLAALALIWIARLSITRDVYVSEMGATGEPTARVFQLSLLLVVAGGSLIAYASRDIHSRLRILRAWSPAVSLWIASGFFFVASQVTCTPGCPVPSGPQFTWQDLTHIVCAVIAFAAACWAMLQVSFAHHHRHLAILSRASGASVAVIAGAGGILSLVGVATGFGSRLEFVATTIAIGWVAAYGAVVGFSRPGTAIPAAHPAIAVLPLAGIAGPDGDLGGAHAGGKAKTDAAEGTRQTGTNNSRGVVSAGDGVQ